MTLWKHVAQVLAADAIAVLVVSVFFVCMVDPSLPVRETVEIMPAWEIVFAVASIAAAVLVVRRIVSDIFGVDYP